MRSIVREEIRAQSGVLPWAAVLAALLVVAIWALDRELPAETIGDPVVSPGSVRPGARYVVNVLARRSGRSCPATVTRTLWHIEGPAAEERYTLIERVQFGQTGTGDWSDRVSFAYRLPADMPEGVAEYRFEVAYRCNPLHYVWPVYRHHAARFVVAD